MSKFNRIIEKNNLYLTEGSAGVSNLCQIAALIGYRDPMGFGSLSAGGKIGDLICFLEDNPGCVEAILTWIEDNEDAFDLDEGEDEDEEDE